MATGDVVVSTGFALSVAVMPTVVVPAMVGVPERTQPEPSVRPAGSVPEATVQLYGAVPPVTGMVPVYGVFTVAVGGVLIVKVELPGFTVTGTLLVVVFVGLLESVAFTMMVLVPETVGVPVIWQLLFRVRPACSVPLCSTPV